MLKFSFQRILNQRKLRILICILLLIPVGELLLYVYQIIAYKGYIYIPDYAFFLTCNSAGIGHVFQTLFLWFMPLYCLLLTADDCMMDHELHYNNILISKVGRKAYMKQHLLKSWIVSFGLVAFALLFNLLLCHILFQGGVFNPYGEDNSISAFYQWEIAHPLLTNIGFSVVTAFVCSLISVVGTITSILFEQKKIVYGITMILWVIPFLQEKSLMLLFQPHSEYVLDTLVPIALKTCIPYIVYILVGYVKEVYFAKKTC